MAGGQKYRGRKIIYANVKAINKENLLKVIADAWQVHQQNVKEIKFLDDYEKGIQPIRDRVKEVRPEINERITENHAHEIVQFKVGYMFGSPIAYVQRAGGDKELEESKTVTKVGEMLYEQSKSSKDQQLATTFNKVGIAYRGIFPIKSSERVGISLFRLVNMDPKSTFVIRSNDIYKDVLAGVSYSTFENENRMKIRVFGVYTKDKYYEFEIGGSVEGDIAPLFMGDIKIEEKENGIGAIPIIEYINDYDRMGSFERVLPLLNALNVCTSDRLNGLAQFVQSLLWFHNVDVDSAEYKELRESGAIATKSNGAEQVTIQFLTQQLNQSEVQTLADYLYDQIIQIACIPGREQSTGGNTGQAIMLGGSGWQLAETSAKKQEDIFKESEQQALFVIKKIIEKANIKEIKTIEVSDIDIKFTRNKVSNLLTKTQGLVNQLSAGIDPRTAIANCDLYSDPEQVHLDSREYLKKWLPQEETKEVDTVETE